MNGTGDYLLNKISQAEKDKYCVFSLIHGTSCNSGWPQTCYMAKAGPELLILLPPYIYIYNEKYERNYFGKEGAFWEKEREQEKVKGEKRGNTCGLSHVVSRSDIFIHMSHRLRGQEGDQQKGGGWEGSWCERGQSASAVYTCDNIIMKPLFSMLTKMLLKQRHKAKLTQCHAVIPNENLSLWH